MTSRIAFATAVALAASPALANDSTAEIGAGGLQLIQNDKVELLREDLRIGPERIDVRYAFRNRITEPVTFLVAFPLPPIDAITPQDMNIVLPKADDPNFVGFTVTVDGKPLTPSLNERATIFGIDRSDALRSRGLALNPIADGLYQKLDALPREDIAALNRLGLVTVDEYSVMADWKYEATFFWEQTFPPQQEVIVEHSYQPVSGFGFFYDGSLDSEEYRAKYCIDEDFAAAARRKLATVANSDNPYLEERRISYILTTAGNWAGAIGEFHLTVDKGSPDALVSLCADGIRKTGETTFEWTQTTFYPERELEILIVRPFPPQQ